MGKRTNTAVWMDKHQRWQIKVQKDGERRTFYSSAPGRTGQRECNAKADAWLDDGIVGEHKRVRDMLDEWYEDLKLTTSRSHYRQYKSYMEHWIKPKIGSVKMADLSEGHLQSVINNAYGKGKLARKTLQNIRACLTAFVKYSRRHKATSLIIDGLDIPKSAVAGEREILQPDDLKTLFSVDTVTLFGKRQYDLYVNAYRLEVITGLRPGEVLGLEWNDIAGADITIRRSINVYNEETRGKNDNARRSFSLTPLAVEVLARQLEALNAAGLASSKWVFPNEGGGALSQSTYYKRWVRYRDENGIVARSSPYELRHTFVSVVKALPQGLLKKIVGHSVDMDTYGIYSHELAGDAQQAADLIQDIFNGLLAPNEDVNK